ncbi:MAG: hypothetical protein P8123_07770 [bacterium]
MENPAVPSGRSAFYSDLGFGAFQWDTLGYFDVTETTAGTDVLVVVDLKSPVMEGTYASQGYTASLSPLLLDDGAQLLFSMEFDLKNADAFVVEDAGLAWDDDGMGSDHFESSVTRKMIDENGEIITDSAVFAVEGAVDPTPTETPVGPEPTPTPEPVEPDVTPMPTETPVTDLAIEIVIAGLTAGEGFDLELSLNESITSPFDFYLFAELMGNYYTISMNGAVKAGITPLYRNVPGFVAPYSTTIRSMGIIPSSLAGVKITFYTMAVESGRIPAVGGIDELGPDSGNVIVFDSMEADVR